MTRRLLLFFILALPLLGTAVPGRAADERIKVIIDTDVAMGYAGHDVDDGLALLIALNSPELEILGVTAAWGNYTQPKTFAKAREILSAAGREDIPCFSGASSPRDLGRETDASRFIARTVLQQPGEVTILAIGTLTNVATAFQSDPAVAPAVKQVVAMGGTMAPPGKWPKWAMLDLNFGADIPSTQTVMGSGIPFHCISSTLCLQAPMTPPLYHRMVSEAPFMREMIVEQTRSWWSLKYVLPSIPGQPSIIPWDVTALAYLLHPEWFRDRWVRAEIDDQGWGKKTVVVYEDYLPAGQGINAPDRLLDESAYWEWFMDRI